MCLEIRFCKKCGQAYDIGVEFENCPACRMEKIEDEKTRKRREDWIAVRTV